ncbi:MULTISPECIES: hypothetical protein [unclassified Pseudomonas]|uniref:hypothetical protein n=1 Tax=unclassified Pseudomonas TaxID=196821 RepID=UPI003FA2DC22
MAARTPTGKPRGRAKGCVKTGGRVAGKSLDKNERIRITGEMAGNILAVFERLGGEDFLYRWAKENQTAFVNSCLSRLMPPMPKDDPDIQINQQFNTNNMSEFEAARRVAFMLAKATHGQDEQELPPVMEAVRVTSSRPAPEPVEQPQMSPQEACRWGAPDQPNPSLHQDDLERDMARERWAASLHLTPEERADRELIRNTRECSLETYHGSSAEQFDTPTRPSSRQLSPGERCRALSRRGRDLL